MKLEASAHRLLKNPDFQIVLDRIEKSKEQLKNNMAVGLEERKYWEACGEYGALDSLIKWLKLLDKKYETAGNPDNQPKEPA